MPSQVIGCPSEELYECTSFKLASAASWDSLNQPGMKETGCIICLDFLPVPGDQAWKRSICQKLFEEFKGTYVVVFKFWIFFFSHELIKVLEVKLNSSLSATCSPWCPSCGQFLPAEPGVTYKSQTDIFLDSKQCVCLIQIQLGWGTLRRGVKWEYNF